MRHRDRQPFFDDNAADDVGASRADSAGPQGAALILELQRLRRAFDEENPDNRRPRGPSRDRAEADRRRPPPKHGKPKKGRSKSAKHKSKVGQAIDVCLVQFGLKTPVDEPYERQIDEPRARQIGEPRKRQMPRDVTGAAPRRPSPPIAPDQPAAIDAAGAVPTKPTAGELHRTMHLEPLVLPQIDKPDPAVEHWTDRSRAALVAGYQFIAGGGDGALLHEATATLALRTRRSYENELRTGLRILLAAIVLGGGWFVFVPLAGAVVVPGNLVVQSNVKTIQHPTGGVVAEIKVQNGTRVLAGDLLMRLDKTQAETSLQVVDKQLDEVRAREARLIAERDDRGAIDFPEQLTARSADENVKSLMASENALFKARFTTRQSQKDLLQNKISQFTDEISGLGAQTDSKAKQIELISGELAGVQDLYDKHLVPLTRLTALQRDAARIEGERGQLTSSIAETKSKIGEAQLQIVRTDQDFRADVVKQLSEVQSKESELVERSVAAHDLVDRIEIRAPTSGIIQQLAAHTIGGVIKAGETIMEIVPDTDDLQIEAHVQPKDIDHVRTGQNAFVRLSAFNQRTTPQIRGTVSYVSADIGQDKQTNSSSYTVRVTLPEEERRRLNGQQLVPGMPAEVFVQTGSRSMMSYVFEPINDQMRRAFVEQ
ncbi:MAG: HlyD family type I secretion periplasmic adaptor subunit [Acetobacteraceae bacterium]|nr:HlyD family type I secretion periplasmic adaptor subunit [Acetobacteraceae bacterium]